MPVDLRHVPPSQLLQLLNSTPLGEVVSKYQLQLHRTRAGLNIGDGQAVDLQRHAAWLFHERGRIRQAPQSPTGYDAMREGARARNVALSVCDLSVTPLAGRRCWTMSTIGGRR
ncbi:MAG: hypothetical protein ACE5EX_09960 [Phycisphaerae bacterium]